MTCIAAAIDLDGTIYMGGDSVSLQGDCVRIDQRSKVFRVGPFLFHIVDYLGRKSRSNVPIRWDRLKDDRRRDRVGGRMAV